MATKKVKIITSPKGYDLIDVIGGLQSGDKFMRFIYRKRSKIGKLIGIKKIKKVLIPKGHWADAVNNHTPKIGKIKIIFVKSR